MRATSKATVEKARSLRRALTPPEVALWQYLRDRPDGLKFRRQHPIGPFVADFYCPSAKLIVEVDGAAHDMGTNPARDVERNAWFVARGFQIVRVPAAEVKADVQAVVTGVVAAAGA